MDLIDAVFDLLTDVNNPLANSSPVIAACFAWWAFATGLRHHRFSAGRRLGTGICAGVVTYSAVLRILLEFDVITTETFLACVAPNTPLIFSCFAYLFWARAQANIRMERDSKIIDEIVEEYCP